MFHGSFPTRVAGLAGALVAVDLVDAGPVVTGVAFAVVDVDLAVDSCRGKKLVKVFLKLQKHTMSDICVCVCVCVCGGGVTGGALGAAAHVGVLSVLAGASVPARLAQALVDVGLAQPPGVAGAALAAEGGQAVDAGAVVARVGVTLVDVRLTVSPRVTWGKKNELF